MEELPQVKKGGIRQLHDSEKMVVMGKYGENNYVWVSCDVYTCNWKGKTLTVPSGFLTDGSSGGPDVGSSWIFHDFLYATHKFDDNVFIKRRKADKLMHQILISEHRPIYAFFFKIVARMNPFYLMDKAWNNSFNRGPQYYGSF